MIEPPKIIQTPTQDNAMIHLTIPWAEIRHVMGPGIGEIMAALVDQGISPVGPWFCHHLKMDPEIFDFEISVPVDSPVEPTGRVKKGRLDAREKVARTVYHGPYEGLINAWGELMDWIAENGHTPAPDLWEAYMVGPETSANPADWRTELSRPVE